MAYVGKSAFAACFAAVALSIVSSASRADTPEPQGEAYHLSESDFRDLRDYMDRAKTALETALDAARALPDSEAHATLVHGITQALAQGAAGDDLLLFRYELGRALETDVIFTTGAGEDALSASSSSVLVPSIERALQYYRSDDDPRMHSVETFLPDWACFVHDQIPIWLRTADFAPQAARQQIVTRALGWAARALNKSAVARRNFAKQIVALADMEKALESGQANLSDGEQLLLDTTRALGGAGMQPAATGSTPPSSFPGTDRARDRTFGEVLRSTFPIDVKGSDGIGTGDWPTSSGWTDDCDHRSGVEFSGNIAGGGGITIGPGGTTSMGQASGGAMVFAGTDHGFGSGFADVKGTLGQAGGTPIYTFKATGALTMFYVVDFYGAFEANQFSKFQEQIARFEWGPTLPFIIGTHKYVLVHFGVGGAMGGTQWPNSNQKAANETYGTSAPGTGGVAWNVTAILKLAKFFLSVEVNQDFNMAGPQDQQAMRTDLALQLAVPLHLIFKNDEIRFEGRLIDYAPEGSADFSNTMITNAGAYYGLRW